MLFASRKRQSYPSKKDLHQLGQYLTLQMDGKTAFAFEENLMDGNKSDDLADYLATSEKDFYDFVYHQYHVDVSSCTFSGDLQWDLSKTRYALLRSSVMQKPGAKDYLEMEKFEGHPKARNLQAAEIVARIRKEPILGTALIVLTAGDLVQDTVHFDFHPYHTHGREDIVHKIPAQATAIQKLGTMLFNSPDMTKAYVDELAMCHVHGENSLITCCTQAERDFENLQGTPLMREAIVQASLNWMSFKPDYFSVIDRLQQERDFPSPE